MKCCVPNCTSSKEISTFGVPKNENLKKQWETIFGIFLKSKYRVCAAHFHETDIIKSWVSGQGLSTYSICLKIPKLRDGAIPFSPNNNLILNESEHDQLSVISYKDFSIKHDHCYSSVSLARKKIKLDSYYSDNKAPELHSTSLFYTVLNHQAVKVPLKWFIDIDISDDQTTAIKKAISFQKLTSFSKNYMKFIEKQLVLIEDLTIILYIYGKEVTLSDIGITSNNVLKSLQDLENIISKFDQIKICIGAISSYKLSNINLVSGNKQYVDSCGQWHHVNCLNILQKNESDMCVWCKRLLFGIKKKAARISSGKLTRTFFSPNKKKALNNILKAKKILLKKCCRAKKKINKLQQNLIDCKNKMKKINDSSLSEILINAGISKCQSELIQEIFSAARLKNAKNRKYNENWMLLCLLFQIRSPSGYRFLRDQKILPLPCVNTIRKNLLAIKVGCGFDPNFFKLLNKNFAKKSDSQKIGILSLDEIFLRESINVNTRTLTYTGLVDFGNEINNQTASSEKANHGLVLMWQSLADNFTQPIAVFASKGSVKGADLAKIVTKSILLLENVGGKVVGITNDGATTNRTMWKLLGISANEEDFKNYFENPFDSSRKIFVFSDPPHLMKTIRNRLFEKKQLRWDHYHTVYKYEENSLTKVCPKLTKHHFELNNLLKMKVKYAVQLFSASMPAGIQFYKNKNYLGFENCEEAIKFTVIMNSMFDALNRKFPAEGIKKNSKDIENLKESLQWIKEWECNLKNNLISDTDFLTKQTAEGLKITLQSTIDLVNVLLNDYGFNYVLTAKINQDCLEKFFGIIRQISGPNDHPTTPTFLQLYRMLSINSLIKPPKAGNCSVSSEENVPAISVKDFKEIINDPLNSSIRENKIQQLKDKIDQIIENNIGDLEDIITPELCHSSLLESPSFNCTVYYLSGYIARKFLKRTKCELCIAGLKNLSSSSSPEAELVNLKSKGYLTHPNQHLFLILRSLELSFVKHADSSDVFNETLSDFLSTINTLTFECNVHQTDMLTDICSTFVIMRMRQYTYIKNQMNKKQNKTKKKLSKLVGS